MLECFAIWDDKMKAYFSPMFMKSKVDAIRSLSVAVQEPQSNLNRFTEDFSLWFLGQLDEETGALLLPDIGRPVKLADLTDFKNKGKI